MAERVYRKRSAVGVQSPSYGSAAMPSSVSVIPSATNDGEATTRRVYKKKATATVPETQETAGQRTYTVRPEVRAYKNAQNLQTWGNDVTALSKDVTSYFEDINGGGKPTTEAYGQMIGRIDSAISAIEGHRAAYGSDADVTAYVDDVENYLRTVRGEVEKYRDGIEGVLYQEMADRVAAAGDKNPAKVTEKVTIPDVSVAQMEFDNIKRRKLQDPTWVGKHNVANVRDANVKALAHDAATGLAQFNQGLYHAADWLILDDEIAQLFGVENKVGQFFDRMDRQYDDIYAQNERLDQYANKAVAFIGDNVITPAVAALPNLAVAMMSGGGTTAAQLSAGGGSALATYVGNLMKNPSFWLSFAQAGGGAYAEAKASGASELEAQATAWLTAFPSAMVEIGGGVEKIPTTKEGVLAFVKNAVEEGGEEVLQGIIEQAARTAVFEQEKQWISFTDTDAIVSLPRAAQEFIGGVTVGAVLGGGFKATQYAYQSYQYAKLGEQFISGENGVTIDDAIAIGLDNAKGTDAYNAAVKIQQKVQKGESVSPYAVGRMVAQSQTEQAQTARAIERTVLDTAKEMNIPTDAAETVSAAAVSLGQKVEFVSPEGMHNRYMAGEYDSSTDTVRLNAAERNVDKLIGAVLAHEMVHTAEGTDQLQKLAQIAQRMENHKNGAGAWEKLQADVKRDYAKANKQLSDPGVKREALAHWIGKNLFTNKAFAKAVADGDANVGNAFFYLIDRLRRAMGAKKASAGNLAMLERLFMQALDNRTLGPREGDVRGAFKGYDPETGLPIYESNFPKGTLKSAKSKRILKLIQDVWSKEPIPLIVKEEGKSPRKIEAQFDPTYSEVEGEFTDASKLMGGNRHGSASEQRVTLDLADDYYQIASDAVYNYSKDEKGKTTETHRGVTQWHYFINDILFQEYGQKETTPYRVTINVKERSDGHFVYSFSAERQNKGSSTRRTLHADDTTAESGSNAQPNTNVAQNAHDVNTQSMQEGAGTFTDDGGNTAQGALLSPESMEAVRNGTWREARAEGADPNANVERDNPSVTADAATPPFTQGNSPAYGGNVREADKGGPFPGEGRHAADAAMRGVEGAAPYGADLSIDEAAVLDTALRSGLQGKQVADVSDLKKTKRRGQTHYDHDAAIDRLETELGKDEMLRRMYNATRMDRPKGIAEVDGRQVDAGAYMDAYERQLPDDVATLEQTVRYLEKQRAEEILRMEREGKLEGYTFGGLKLDLQLFAAKRKYDLLQLDPGESGTEVRQFYEKRLRGTDANHNDELVEMLSGRTETYNPICNEETLADAKKYLDSKKNEDSLLQRIGEYNNDDLFDAKEVAAATVLINRAINDGDLGEAADMIIGLSRKGTIAGRAVQAYSMMARMTPEGTLKAAIRTMRAEADTIICKGASEKLDVLADDIVKAIEEAEDNGLSSKEIIDRIRKGVVGKDAPVQFDHVPQDLADQVSEATGTDVTGYTIVVSTEAMQAIVDGGANVETLVDTDAETLQIIVRDGTDTGTTETATAQQLTEGKKRLPAKLTREELVQLLSEDLAAEKGNFFTQEEIYDLLWKTVNEAANVPEQVKRYVLKKIRKDDGGLAQRIYELHKRGDLKQTKLRRAIEEALELPHLTDEDLKWVVEKATKIQALESDPVKQADAMDELYDYLGAKMHVSTLEMLAAWRKFGMLFNAKTHLRNIFSNLAYMGVRKMDSAIAMAIERVFVRDRSQWGAALGWSHTEHGKNLLPQLQKQAELAVLEMQNRGPKYEQGTGQLKRYRKMFGTSKLGEKVNATSDWNSDMLEAEDIKFFRPAYIDALGQLMTARGVTEITTELHDIAMQRALEATFRNRNYISEWLSAPRRGLSSDKEFVRVMANLYDVAIPFVNTPAAVAEQSIWHTPIGIVKGAFDLYNATKGKGTKDIATAINTLSKGITGTALFAIGILLGNAGLFHVGFGRTDKERAADEMEGLQDGALVIGGASISLDWLQPAASPLIVGASLATNKREKGWSLSTVFGAVFDGTDSLFELTMLQSLYDVLGGYEAGPSGSLASIGENYVGQSTPTLLGQLARAIDPVQRKTKGDNAFETAVNQVMAKIPGLTYLLDPELDVWGNEVYRTGKASTRSAAWNAIQQFVSPANAKIGTGKDDPISQEILRLYADLDTSAVIPSEITYDEAAEIGEERVDLNRLLGGINRLAVEEFVGNEKAYAVMVETGKLTEKGNPQTKRVTKYYRDMTDDERRRVLSNIYKNTKAEVTGDTEGKTESQLTDSERYIRGLLRRVRSGDRGTFDGAAVPTPAPAQPQQEQPQQENTSYYADLLRRMKNGN